IVYTTHDMEEADKLCDRIAIMDRGKIIAEGTSLELKSRYGGSHRIELELEEYDEKLIAEIKELVGARVVERKDGALRLTVPTLKGGILHNLSSFLTKRKTEVLELRAIEPSLEDVFINLTSKELRD